MTLVLVFLALAAFLPALKNGFVSLDDAAYVTANPHVRGGFTWADIQWAFYNTRAANWHPVTWLSHIADYAVFGLRAWGHHLTNVLLHAINTALVFLVFRRLTRATWRSWVVAALFGLHPLRVESVAWIAERKDVLSGLFFLLTLWTYAKYAEKPPTSNLKSQIPNPKSQPNLKSEISNLKSEISNPKSRVWYWVSVVLFALGLMSKPMLVTLPFVLLLLDYWPLGRMAQLGLRHSKAGVPKAHGQGMQMAAQRSPEEAMGGTAYRWTWKAAGGVFAALLIEKIPFLLASAVVSAITFLAQQSVGAMTGARGLPLELRLENGLVSYARYLGKLFWPARLAVAYPYPAESQWPAGVLVLAVGVLVVVSVGVLIFGGRFRYLTTGWLWFLGMLVPVLGLAQVGVQAMADRYLYLPAIGIFIMAVWSVGDWLERVPAGKVLAAAGTACALGACVAATWRQIGFWKDDETLFRHAFAAEPGNYMAHFYLGNALAAEGRMDEAVQQFETSMRLRPNAEAELGLGLYLLQHQRTGEAIAQFQNAIKLNPNLAEAHYRLGFALFQIGKLDEAIAQYHQALALQPDSFDAHNDLGVALARKGQTDAALAQLQQAVRLKPDSPDALYNFANALLKAGRLEEALREFAESLRLNPRAPDVRNNFGVALTRRGRLDDAIAQFRQALELKPDYFEAQRNLAAAMAFKAKETRAE